mmetsp:Transcript_92752/g.278260  ORF Transcript_92752/g.278260 Transcript_92752/m.278260 type:complete len:277 (-) Transcript_92752:1616-2446(-)
MRVRCAKKPPPAVARWSCTTSKVPPSYNRQWLGTHVRDTAAERQQTHPSCSTCALGAGTAASGLAVRLTSCCESFECHVERVCESRRSARAQSTQSAKITWSSGPSSHSVGKRATASAKSSAASLSFCDMPAALYSNIAVSLTPAVRRSVQWHRPPSACEFGIHESRRKPCMACCLPEGNVLSVPRVVRSVLRSVTRQLIRCVAPLLASGASDVSDSRRDDQPGCFVPRFILISRCASACRRQTSRESSSVCLHVARSSLVKSQRSPSARTSRHAR